MPKYWKDKPGEPIVSCWYYNVEVYGITYSFIDIEDLKDFRNLVAARKLSSPRSWFSDYRLSYSLRNILQKNGFYFLKHRLREDYILFRHRKEIVRIFDQAYKHFLAEQENEEIAFPKHSSRDWR
jgi:hypothetical protein